MARIFSTPVATLILLCSSVGSVVAENADLQAAREHYQRGRYAEAAEAYERIADDEALQIPVALGRYEIHMTQGEWQAAADILKQVAQQPAKHAAVQAAIAELNFKQGQYTQARSHAETALKISPDNLRARLILAHVQTETGELKAAQENYVWFVRYYNRVQPTSAEDLLYVAQGSLQYARWKSSSQIFGFVLNTLAPDALKDNPACWQAHDIAGSILREKYNRAQALPELERALAMNPHATSVHIEFAAAAWQKHKLEEAATHAKRALTINPQSIEARQILADLAIQAGKLDDAQEVTEQALKTNPHEQRTLARQAAIHLLKDGGPASEVWQKLLLHVRNRSTEKIAGDINKSNDSVVALVLALHRENPSPGEFWNILGELLEGRRKFQQATDCFQTAIDIMPQLAAAKTNLGMLYMRVGQTDKAATTLDEAFTADRFHVRVSNLRKVLKLLDGYATIETEHFIIRVDNTQDEILGHYMAEYLEEIYPELTKKFGYEPPGRTIFEIYHDGKGLSAHQWFSARMVGLPWIQTIGASTGMIVALASPTAVEKPYNWARVLKHEYVHILTLQQTGFNIPHWFTEALAVTSEGTPRPGEWNELLLERVPKNKLWSLLNLNDGFIRPESPDDWQFAYCQSRLYAQYMIEQFGEDIIAELLDAYKRNLPTEKAIPEVFDISLEKFEAGYLKFLQEIVAGLQSGQPRVQETTLADAEKAWLADPEDFDAAAVYAQQLLIAKQFPQAEKLATTLNKKQPQDPRSALVLAQLKLRQRDLQAAIALMEPAVDLKQPHPKLLELLGRSQLIAKDHAAAIRWFELGRETFPHELDWERNLAKAYLADGETEKLIPVLESLVQRAGDDSSIRKTLMQFAFNEKKYERTIRYGKLVIEIDALDAEVHRTLGLAYLELQQPEPAIRELQFALKLEPGDETAGKALRLARALQEKSAIKAD